ncbi:unnamed protein product [Arctia plantaginis]|uniref:Uncharacterized protein n=1 Tax=Arctia plantaginis TaxID=874455 RepID=A0A8S1AVZ4_ARCPL|nr:unnamed protein product [Arctia plantaginis]CAB3250475.1 unnamed protein product [Arctia plantaginis]
MKRRVWLRADTIAAAAAARRAKPSQNRSRGQRSAEFCVDHPSPPALLYHASSCPILIAPVFMTRNTITDIVPGRRNRKVKTTRCSFCCQCNKSFCGLWPQYANSAFDLCLATSVAHS